MVKSHDLTGSSGRKPALSILDMDQEREVDLIYMPETNIKDDTSLAVASLSIHAASLEEAREGGGQEIKGRPRMLVMTFNDGQMYSLHLDTPSEIDHYGSPLRGKSHGPPTFPLMLG